MPSIHEIIPVIRQLVATAGAATALAGQLMVTAADGDMVKVCEVLATPDNAW